MQKTTFLSNIYFKELEYTLERINQQNIRLNKDSFYRMRYKFP